MNDGHFGYKQKFLEKDTGSLGLSVPPYLNWFETAEYNSRLFLQAITLLQEHSGKNGKK